MAGGHDRAVRAAHCGRVRDRPGLHQEQQPVAGRAADRRPRLGLPAALAETGVAEPVAHASYLINLGEPRRRPLGEVDRLARRRGRARRGPGDRRPGHAPGGPRRPGGGRRPGADRPGPGRGPSPDPGVAIRIALETTAGQGTCLGHRFEHLGRSWSRSASPSGSGSASTPAIFSRRGIPWAPRRSTMTRWRSWSGPSGPAGSGSCTSTTASARWAAGSTATPGSAAGDLGLEAVPPPGQRPEVPGPPDDPGDAQGGRRGRGPRRRQLAGPPGVHNLTD